MYKSEKIILGFRSGVYLLGNNFRPVFELFAVFYRSASCGI